jgi:hypothetical protein
VASAASTVSPPTAPGAVTIAVTVGTDSSPTRIEHIPRGSTVTLQLTDPSSADQYHLHGYDLETEHIPAGTTAKITFTADRAGTFEVESHETEDVLVQLEVS